MPDASAAKQEYETRYTGHLADENPFGIDPLRNHIDLTTRRLEEFSRRFQVKSLFQDCINHRPRTFENALLFFIRKTEELSQTI